MPSVLGADAAPGLGLLGCFFDSRVGEALSSRCMKFLLSVVALSLLLLPLGNPASAMGCKGVSESGHCLNATTVEWCSEGVLKKAECPDGEICALHPTSGEGYTCLEKGLTACDTLPPEGLCLDPKTPAWCVAGEVETKVCAEGERCAFEPGNGWVDCVPNESSTVPSNGADVSVASDLDSYSADTGPESTGDLFETLASDSSGPTPNLREGQPWSGTPPVGCASAGSPVSGLLGWLTLLAMLTLFRRRVGRSPQR